MKKSLILFLTLMLLFAATVNVHAAPLDKSVEVSLDASALKVNVGEEVVLTANTAKKGSDFIDVWKGADKQDTYRDKNSLVSTAVFCAENAGTYTVEYSTQMKAGKSHIVFEGHNSITIEVIGSKSIEGVKVKNIQTTELKALDGTTKGYSVVGEIYLVFTDKSETYYGKTFFFFDKGQDSRDVYVTVNYENKEYCFEVNVARD